jgi:hypothetical protein
MAEFYDEYVKGGHRESTRVKGNQNRRTASFEPQNIDKRPRPHPNGSAKTRMFGGRGCELIESSGYNDTYVFSRVVRIRIRFLRCVLLRSE